VQSELIFERILEGLKNHKIPSQGLVVADKYICLVRPDPGRDYFVGRKAMV
jgi:hypothetical protein